MADDLSLEDLAPEDRKQLAPNNPLVLSYADRVGAENGLPSGLLPAIIAAGERSGPTSGKNKDGISPKGATGLAQLMPATAKELGVDDPKDPFPAIAGAGRYLAQSKEKLGTDDPGLLAASYNAGQNHPAVLKGQIPRIPETQGYVARVKAYMSGKTPTQAPGSTSAPAPAADTPTIGWADLTPADREAMRTAGAAPDPTGSTWENIKAGAGKALVDTVRGAAQLGVDAIVNPLSRAATGRDLVDSDALMKEEAERKRLDEALMNTGGGLTGYGLGTAATTILPGGALAKAPGVAAKLIPGAGRAAEALAARPGVVSAAARALIPQAAAGAGLSATQPVSEPGERSTNVLTGGVVGGVLGATGSALAASPLGSAARGLYDKVAGAAPNPLVRPSWSASASAPARAAAEQMISEDVPLYASQLAKPGSSQPMLRAQDQRAQLGRAVVRTFGEDTTDVVSAFQNAPDRIGAVYNSVLPNVIPLGGTHLADLQAASAFNGSRLPRFDPDPTVQKLINGAYADAQQNHFITGQQYQDMMSSYKATVRKLLAGNDVTADERHAVEALNMLQDAMSKAAERVMPPKNVAAFREANQQWRNMSLLDSLAPRTADGDINVKQFVAKIARDKNNFVYGQNDQTLPNLARGAATFIGQPKPGTGVWGQAKDMMKQYWPFLALDVGGAAGGAALAGGAASTGPEGTAEGHGLSKLAPYAGGLAGALAVHSLGRRALDPRMTLEALQAPRGALGEWFSRTQPGPAAAYTYEAARPTPDQP